MPVTMVYIDEYADVDWEKLRELKMLDVLNRPSPLEQHIRELDKAIAFAKTIEVFDGGVPVPFTVDVRRQQMRIQMTRPRNIKEKRATRTRR